MSEVLVEVKHLKKYFNLENDFFWSPDHRFKGGG